MKSLSLLIVLLFLSKGLLFAQVGINTNGSPPDPSAMLDVKSTTSRNNIPSPATGLLIYNTTTNHFNYYNGTSWCQLEATYISSTSGVLSPGGGVSINTSPSVLPDNSAMLDVNNPTRGVLIPRIVPGSITAPAAGLTIYNTASNLISYYNGMQYFLLPD